MLQIKNLNVSVNNKKILNDFNLEINTSEIHALMGQNGTGKSTLCKVLMKDPEYTVNSGSIIYNGKDITNMSTTEIAREKIFLLNQNPIAIEGVTNAEMLRMTLSEVTGKQVNIFTFNKELENLCDKLGLPRNFIHREINVGMSGGERKKNELLHMWMLKPSLILLDEIDSGLDVDAINTVAKSINEYYSLYKPTILIITHHEKLLELIKPNTVHVISNGKVLTSGDISLAKTIENVGFNNLNEAFDISDDGQDE